MANNYGKKWEKKFAADFSKVPGSMVTRLFDITNGYKSISNISDFICYIYPYIYYLECKSTQGNTFPLSRLTQKDDLAKTMGKQGVNAGVILWFIDHYKVCYVSIEEILRLEALGAKSINVKMIGDSTYNVVEIPSEKRRLFVDCDFTILKDIADTKMGL